MGHKDDRKAYCHFGAQEMFTIKVPKSGCGDWWVRMIVLALVLANKFDPFFLWDIGIQ